MSAKDTNLDEGLENQPKPHQKAEDGLENLAVPAEVNVPAITGKEKAKRPADKDNAEALEKVGAPKVESIEIDDTAEAKIVAEQGEVDVSLSEDIKSMLESIDLPEEFKSKATTLFEAAVSARVADIRKELVAVNETKMQEYKDTLAEKMNLQIEEKISFATAQWLEENQVAIKANVRTQIAESFMAGLHDLFESHYITVPEGKEDILESTAARLAEVEATLEAQVEKNVKLTAESVELQKALVLESLSKNLTDTQAERVKEMVESIGFETSEQYSGKVSTIIESLTATKPSEFLVEDGAGEVVVESKSIGEVAVDDVNPEVAAYAAAISKLVS